MIRFLTRLSLVLIILFSGIGLLLSRAWGWSEYTSPRLYLIFAVTTSTTAYYLMDITHPQAQMLRLGPIYSDDRIRQIVCSPDGRTLAFTTDSMQLEILTRTGMVYKGALDQQEMFHVANNGVVSMPDRRVSASGVTMLPLPDAIVQNPGTLSYYSANAAASGIAIWANNEHPGFQIQSAANKLLAYFPDGFSAQWLGTEQIVFFRDASQQPYPLYLYDVASGEQVRLHTDRNFTNFVPDGMTVISNDTDPATYLPSIHLDDTQSGQTIQSLSDGIIEQYYTVCVLAFRPTALISQH